MSVPTENPEMASEQIERPGQSNKSLDDNNPSLNENGSSDGFRELTNPEVNRKSRRKQQRLPGGGSIGPDGQINSDWWRPNWFTSCWSSEAIMRSTEKEKSSSKSDPRSKSPGLSQYSLKETFENRLAETRSANYNYREYSFQPRPRIRVYTMEQCIVDAIASAFAAHSLEGCHVAKLVVEFHAIYSWIDNPNAKYIKVARGHDNTVARNSRCEFGVVLGTTLDQTVDHVINLRIDDGVEFGVGVCTNSNANLDAKRDFMCEEGGWGYYNYKSKFVGMKPKYPSGWYKQTHSCMKHYPEETVLMGGDVLTLTITREGLTKEEQFTGPKLGNGKFTIGFFKNDKPMSCIFRGIEGQLHLCLNYYFMATTIRLLSNHKNPLKVLAEHVAQLPPASRWQAGDHC